MEGCDSTIELLPPCPRARDWSRREDSNPRPSDYKSDALPTELRRPNALLTHHTPGASLASIGHEPRRDGRRFASKAVTGGSCDACDRWLGGRDSNPDKQIQSLPCYRYTTSQYGSAYALSIPATAGRPECLRLSGVMPPVRLPPRAGLRASMRSGFVKPSWRIRSLASEPVVRARPSPTPPAPQARI